MSKEYKPHKGDTVIVTQLDEGDRARGYSIGDVFRVCETDDLPYCRPLYTKNPDAEQGWCALSNSQIRPMYKHPKNKRKN